MVSRMLPEAHGLFLGNSMPIRDMDMYADSGGSAMVAGRGAGLGAGCGVPVGSNRGASGIDGVVSAASGFAAGLGRPVTLLIGDVSFTHDVNGLLLLRDRTGQPPLTIVLINNGGGNIFNFLPVASELEAAEFSRLFETPPDVRFAELCRAHRLVHLQARTPRGLARALAEAWRLGRHCCVEVVLRGEDQGMANVASHRAVEAAAAAAVRRSLAASSATLAQSFEEFASLARSEALGIVDASVSPFRIPLALPITAIPAGGDHTSAGGMREGLLLRVSLRCGAVGIGEIAPCPGVHLETLAEAHVQSHLAAALLVGCRLDAVVALLDGSLADWLGHAADGPGLRMAHLLPSVRFGLESALLSALAAAQGCSLGSLLVAGGGMAATHDLDDPMPPAINALIPGGGGVAEALAAATAAAQAGYQAVKIKVGRQGSSPAEDGERCCAVRRALGPHAVLRADANGAWTLEAAVQFAAAAAEAQLDYVEDPCANGEDLGPFHTLTGVRTAIDEVLCGGTAHQAVGQRGSTISRLGAGCAELPPGVAALVLKPAAVGGLEAAALLGRWAARRGLDTVLSSCFESSVGLAAIASLAQLTDCHGGDTSCNRSAAPAHGLGTLPWLAGDSVELPLKLSAEGSGVVVNMASANQILCGNSVRWPTGLNHSPEQALCSFAI